MINCQEMRGILGRGGGVTLPKTGKLFIEGEVA